MRTGRPSLKFEAIPEENEGQISGSGFSALSAEGYTLIGPEEEEAETGEVNYDEESFDALNSADFSSALERQRDKEKDKEGVGSTRSNNTLTKGGDALPQPPHGIAIPSHEGRMSGGTGKEPLLRLSASSTSSAASSVAGASLSNALPEENGKDKEKEKDLMRHLDFFFDPDSEDTKRADFRKRVKTLASDCSMWRDKFQKVVSTRQASDRRDRMKAAEETSRLQREVSELKDKNKLLQQRFHTVETENRHLKERGDQMGVIEAKNHELLRAHVADNQSLKKRLSESEAVIEELRSNLKLMEEHLQKRQALGEADTQGKTEAAAEKQTVTLTSSSTCCPAYRKEASPSLAENPSAPSEAAHAEAKETEKTKVQQTPPPPGPPRLPMRPLPLSKKAPPPKLKGGQEAAPPPPN